MIKSKKVRVLFLVIGFGLAAYGNADGQETKPETGAADAKTGPQSSLNLGGNLNKKASLFMLVRVGAGDEGEFLDDKVLKDNFTDALQISKSKFDSVSTKAISPSVFRDLNRIVTGEDNQPAWKIELDNKAVLTQANIEDRNLLLIKVPNAQTQIEQMKIETQEKSPVDGEYGYAANDPKRRMILVAPDTYSIPWELNLVVKNIEMTTLNGDKRETTKKDMKGVLADKFYTVSVKNFEGDQRKLYEVVQDPKRFANPITIGKDLSEYTVQLASMGMLQDDSGSVITGDNEWTVKYSQNNKRNVSRVWMLFPLKEAEAKAQQGEFEGKTPKEVIKKIEESANRQTIGQKAAVNPGSPATWIEVPITALDGTMSRSIVLNNPQELLTQFPQFYRLTVYEFRSDEEGINRKEAIRINKELVTRSLVPDLSKAIQKRLEKDAK